MHSISKYTKIKEEAKMNSWHPFNIVLSQNFAYFLQQGSECCTLLCGTKRALCTKLLLYKISSVKFPFAVCLLLGCSKGLLSPLPPLFFDPTTVTIKDVNELPIEHNSHLFLNTVPEREREFCIHSRSFLAITLQRKNPYKILF